MRKRILFNKISVTTRVLKDGESIDDIAGTANKESEGLLDSVDFNIRFCGEVLSGFEPVLPSVVVDSSGNTHPAMGGWPSKEMSFVVPDDDRDRVNAWLTGDFHGVDTPESSKLKNNYQSAVNDLLSSYFNTALIHNLFTSPCRLAWCAVFNNGERGRLREVQVALPVKEAPLLPVISMQIRDGRLYSGVEIRNVPASLEYCIRSTDEIDIDSLGIKRIEVYATEQVSLRDPKSEVFGVRSVSVDGSPVRCWVYDRYSADEIEMLNKIQTEFKQISNIEFYNSDTSEIYHKLPIPSGKLASFNKSKPYKAGFDDDSAEETPPDPTEEVRRVYMETEALSLGYPETDKHLQSVSIFGLFPRNDSNLRFTVYGSHHRENWRKVATSRSPYISGLRGAPFRWFKVGIETCLRPGDFIEAVTFVFSSCAQVDI